MKFIELTVPQDDGSSAAMMFNVANIAAFLPNPDDINTGGGFLTADGTFTKVDESYAQIKEKLNEI